MIWPTKSQKFPKMTILSTPRSLTHWTLTLGLLLSTWALLPSHADAQCRAFTKKTCMPIMEGYTLNENYNSAILIPGDQAELMLTFLGGTNYRLAICSHPVLGDVQFEILDAKGKTLFNSVKAGGADKVDFRVQTTQQLRVNILVPPTKSAIQHEGCVSVLIGTKN
jgi:hypothetical protein